MRRADRGRLVTRLEALEARQPPRADVAWSRTTDAQLRIIAWTDPNASTPEQLRTFAELPRHATR